MQQDLAHYRVRGAGAAYRRALLDKPAPIGSKKSRRIAPRDAFPSLILEGRPVLQWPRSSVSV